MLITQNECYYITDKRIRQLSDNKFLFFTDKPIKTKITVPEEAYFEKRFNITCDSDGQPAPSFTIIHNNTIIIVSNKTIVTYTKDVQYNDAGIYTCIAKNLLGNDSDSGNLTVKGKNRL
jgi:hypothetical protein